MTELELKALMNWIRATIEEHVDSEFGRNTDHCTEYEKRLELEKTFELEEYTLDD